MIHITGLYQYLLTDVDTSYDTLLQVFPTLYQKLNNIKGANKLNTERKIFNFLENNIFKKSQRKSVYHIALALACVIIKKKL